MLILKFKRNYHILRLTLTYSSTDNFLSHIMVSDWLRKFDTSSRKEMKTIKNKNFDEKQEKDQESKWKYKVAFFAATGLKLIHRKSRIAISFRNSR